MTAEKSWRRKHAAESSKVTSEVVFAPDFDAVVAGINVSAMGSYETYFSVSLKILY